jgi:hypothetical protein
LDISHHFGGNTPNGFEHALLHLVSDILKIGEKAAGERNGQHKGRNGKDPNEPGVFIHDFLLDWMISIWTLP